MKILVANRSGNVGKTTTVRHLLAPRIKEPEIVSVETINSDESDEGAIRGQQFALVQDLLLTVDDVVVDVGSSNFESFRDLMRTYDGSHEDFDLFVVPVVPETKQERDTILTIKDLADIGVPPQKIVVLFNKLEREEQIDEAFPMLRAFHASEKLFSLRRDAFVLANPIFATLRKMPGRSIIEIRDDQADYKQMLADAMKNGASEDEKSHIKSLIATKRLAAGVVTQLDSAFKALTRKGKAGE
ncbi:StbB family protein [Paraburkholderia largidicola]|uniref:Plasmid stability protein StbB n=1 Tax=Paraburkholderia largidicola TaxID=3014751 RepID=A0A7I8C3N5_9BURK|nr:StbB family protein [Paraburkholderia sp. PGU16]BCF95423.1 hypothetical protein PPGU16_84900 [Paraburkholderia sp. PGU16]